MVAMRDIEAFGRRIGQTFRPRRVVLFGSYATSQPRADSDVDILVETERGTDAGCQAAALIIRTIQPRFGVDLIVRTRGDISTRLRQNDSFLDTVFRTGRVLYEAAE